MLTPSQSHLKFANIIAEMMPLLHFFIQKSYFPNKQQSNKEVVSQPGTRNAKLHSSCWSSVTLLLRSWYDLHPSYPKHTLKENKNSLLQRSPPTTHNLSQVNSTNHNHPIAGFLSLASGQITGAPLNLYWPTGGEGRCVNLTG